MFSGNLSDFNHVWFNDIGYTIAGAMVFNICFPAIEFVMFWLMRWTFRKLDTGFKAMNPFATKKTTI